MGFKCGIVGLPNVGKSTLFNALTKSSIEAQNYPFCTIEPNLGIVPVQDPRLNQLAELVDPEKIIPAFMEISDIAGLVKGASKGEGLGNQFLANIREVDAILHVVRCFENDDVIHVNNKIDPLSDIEIIETELLLADLDTAQKVVTRLQKQLKTNDKLIKQQYEALNNLLTSIESGESVRNWLLNHKDQLSDGVIDCIYQIHFLTAKPVLYVANVSENGFENNDYLNKVLDYAQSVGSNVVPVCASIEADIAQLEDSDEIELFLSELGLDEPGLNRVVRAGFKLLGLQTYFTAGKKEVRAWTIPIGATAPQSAGKIHTDFEKGFIRAEVISFDDYIQNKGESGAKDAGKWRLEGKTYIVQDGDVVHFRFNT